MEGKLAGKLLVDMAKHKGMPEEKVKMLEFAFLEYEDHIEAYGFCLSENPDQLSQWRGYADDGRGVSIGFTTDFLEQTEGAMLNRIKYKDAEHEKILRPIFSKFDELASTGALDRPSKGTILVPKLQEVYEQEKVQYERNVKRFLLMFFEILPKLFFLKSQAFMEELEWRLVALYENFTNEHKEIDFHAVSDLIKPYTERAICDKGIKEIILGPKNRTPINTVKALLNNNGFMNVEVRISDSSYR